jgi:two-component system NarL family sensor kinase
MELKFNRAKILSIAAVGFLALICSAAASVLLSRALVDTLVITLASTVASMLAELLGGLSVYQHDSTAANYPFERVIADFANAQKDLERSRIARELHDGVCSTLFAAKSWLELALQKASANQTDLVEFCSRSLAELLTGLSDLRRICYDSQPAILSNHEFTDALRDIGRRFTERTHIQTDIRGADASLNETLSPRARASLIRVVQEALTNVEQHSSAAHVVLQIQETNESLTLTITNDGSASRRPNTSKSRTGLGLRNMRDRLADFGGELQFRSGRTGAEVIARAPVGELRRHEAVTDSPP